MRSFTRRRPRLPSTYRSPPNWHSLSPHVPWVVANLHSRFEHLPFTRRRLAANSQPWMPHVHTKVLATIDWSPFSSTMSWPAPTIGDFSITSTPFRAR